MLSLSSDNELKPMDAEQLREHAHKMVDFIADYYKTIEDFPVLSQVKPGYLRNLLPESAPRNPESLQSVLDDVQKKIFPGVTHWQSPSYFAYYPSNSSIAGFLGEMLSAAFNAIGFSWITSPAATELEMIVLDWLAKLLQLPDDFLSSGKGGGVIQGTASEAVLVVLLAARDRALRRFGKDSLKKLVVYASDQTHSALQKACQIGGIHPENCRLLKADFSTNYALSPDVLSEELSHDTASGLIPFFLCATVRMKNKLTHELISLNTSCCSIYGSTPHLPSLSGFGKTRAIWCFCMQVGTTSSTAVDPLPELGNIAKRYEMWFHIDAAYAGSACICPEYRQYINGVEEANSFNMNLHKWFLTNFDCSTLWVKDRHALIQSLSTNPEFLKNKASQTEMVVDYKDWQIPLGRRFRSGWCYDCMIVTPRIFALVCFRLLPHKNEDGGNKLNQSLLDAVNASGNMFISHTVLSGKYILRFAVGAPLTEENHINAAWKLLQAEASALLAN
ncbi:Tyrosine decarboxylase 1, partial [Cucurbita argyrosperma subsp. argyrosperma]